MFGDKLTTANAKITALLGIIAATGFKLNAESISDPKTEASALPTADAFKAHLAEQNKSALSAAVDPLNGQIANLTTAAAVATASVAAFREGLTEAGVKVGEFATAEQGEGNTPEAKAKNAAAKNATMVKTAVETKVAQASAKQIAAAGHPNALDVPPGKSDEPSAAVTPSNATEFNATLKTIKDPGERTAYFRKHRAKFGL